MLYETIINVSLSLADAEKASLMIRDEGTSHLCIKAAKGINKYLLSEIKVNIGEGIAGKVFEEGLPLIVDDIGKNNQLALKKRPRYRTGAFVCIPLKIGGEVRGILNVSDKSTGSAFAKEDISLLRSFAAFASIAIERSSYHGLVSHFKELSITDELTGLFNRRYFEDRFIEELKRSERHALPFSLAIIDIDDFKLFNDTEGHLAGDDILKHVSNIAKDSLRVIDIIARFGGEEFAVIMPQTEKDEAFLVAERIRTSIKDELPCIWKTYPKNHITACIGISTFPRSGRDTRSLIRNADRALFSAKMKGKDRTVTSESL
jgi:diguanylate cyclase (GGDEF)-like protein